LYERKRLIVGLEEKYEKVVGFHEQKHTVGMRDKTLMIKKHVWMK